MAYHNNILRLWGINFRSYCTSNFDTFNDVPSTVWNTLSDFLQYCNRYDTAQSIFNIRNYVNISNGQFLPSTGFSNDGTWNTVKTLETNLQYQLQREAQGGQVYFNARIRNVVQNLNACSWSMTWYNSSDYDDIATAWLFENDNHEIYYSVIFETIYRGNHTYQYRYIDSTYGRIRETPLEYSEDPYMTAPTSEGGDGGYGDFDYSGDDVDFSSLPTISIADSGFVSLYHPTLSELQTLASYMWTGLFDVANFKKLFADPMDCIISLAMIPVDPSGGSVQELKVGNIGTGINMTLLASQFVEVNFETKNIGLRANNFMDFSPYTKAQIFLPFIGVRSLAIDDIAGHDLKIKYKIDLFTGSCSAAIRIDTDDCDSVLYQFTGNVIADIPITSTSFASFIQASIGAVGAAVGVATGAGAVAGVVGSAINAATSMKPDIEKSGNLSATAGFLGQDTPYLILTYPKICIPEGREKVVGQPSFVGAHPSTSQSPTDYPLSRFHGFTKVHKVNIKSIPCTDAERDLIMAQLMEGVIMP